MPFSQKRRAGLRSPNPHSRGSDAKSWLYTDFVIFRFLELTVNSYGRKCLALKLSCMVCASAHLPSLRLMVELGENRVLKSCLWLLPTPQSCYGSLSLIRKVLVTWLFGLLRVRMARPIRGHAWPGGWAGTSKFIITAIQNWLIVALPRRFVNMCHCCVNTISYLPLPYLHGHRLVLCAEALSWSDALSSGESAVVRAGGPFSLSRLSAPLSRHLHTPPHTSSYASVCLLHPSMGVLVCIYLCGVL